MSNKKTDSVWLSMAKTSLWINSEVEVMRTMTHFAVVVKASHLKEVRANVLRKHPEYKNFDDFFRLGLTKTKRPYSQFHIIHNNLWKLRRDEYNWHLQPSSAEDNRFKRTEGVTDEMMFPQPRYALHYTYETRAMNNPEFVEQVLRRGFCYSLTKSDFDAKREYAQLCRAAGFSWDVLSRVPNIDHWFFENTDWRWDNRTIEAHKIRMALNRVRSDWDEKEIKWIFANISSDPTRSKI